MARPASRYIKTFFGLLAAGVLSVGAVNLVIDPYGVFGVPAIDGVNAVKSDTDKYVRLIKAFQVRREPPNTLIVGSSRALLGLPADDPAWPKDSGRVYNLSLYGGYLYEAMRYFEHAAALGTVKRAVLAVDFWMFDQDWVTRPGFSEDRFLVTVDGQPNTPDDLELVRLAFAWDTFRSSLRTLGRQDRDDLLVQYPDGTSNWLDELAWLRSKEGHRAQFGYMEHMFGTTAWQPDRERRWGAWDPADETSPLQFFRRMVRLAHSQGIELNIIISPSHARIWEVIYAGGVWPHWEDWKRALVKIVEEEADMADQTPFPLWDFSGYNGITTEPVPEQRTDPMTWYWDGSHFKQNVGSLVLQRVFGVESADVPDGFGVRLHPATLERTLRAIRDARDAYAETHEQDVNEAARWAPKPN